MISILFNILLFLIPLVFFKTTSELFEFNKIITLYVFTILITTVWLVKSIVSKKFIFRRTILDWPLIVFLIILVLSSIFSLDFRTSIFGYYSRFNGGLLSILSYTLLYWAYVSNMDEKMSKKSVVFLLISTGIASFLAILEHFGFSTTCGLMGAGWNNSCWVQDVQNRVYSTFGQPNWLAATIITLIPILFGFTLIKKGDSIKTNKFISVYFLSIIFFITLLFTKSRSGLLGFAIADLVFCGLILFKFKKEFIQQLVIFNIIFVILISVIGTPWNSSIFKFSDFKESKTENISTSPSLESGGTESGTIRKIVWKGAFKIWTNYPILGTGPETFAFAYPMFKPLEHNLTTEWDFVYNKAHNEYLNYLATTGTLGFISYLTLIGFIVYQLFQNKSKFGISLLAGFISILVTNFFGFSVVPTSLLFFLLPAIALTNNLNNKREEKLKFNNLDNKQKIYISASIIITIIILFAILRYFKADIYYNKARLFNRSDNPIKAREEITKALKISPNEAIFWNESAISNSDIAVLLANNNENDKGLEFAKIAIYESKKAINLAKNNVNFRKTQSTIYIKLISFNNNYLSDAEDTVKLAITISPNDPKLYYQLGLLEIKLNKLEDAISNLEKSVQVKPNYRDARFVLGSIYKDIGETNKANENFKYILEKIAPDDEATKKMYN
jgi:O-antigen ligase/Flp pilus assembly protein TadD